jgi:DNA-binding NarL/FixJ family response regulator
MTNTITVFDASTGLLTERQATPDELANQKELAKEQKEFDDAKDAKIAARQSALAKLAGLGLTEEEIAAL